jgi:hypothetical protein
MLAPHAIMSFLSKHRPVFHSEADFQHSFAWQIHQGFPDAAVRLERPLRSRLGVLHVDIVVDIAGRMNMFELKYKTRASSVQSGSEEFMLQDHNAQPLGRYDFLKDVARLESLAVALPGTASWAIILSNDSSYWKPPRGVNDTSAAFSLCEGRRVTGNMEWSAHTSARMKEGREDAIVLANEYILSWSDYTDIGGRSYSRLRYLALEIPTLAA